MSAVYPFFRVRIREETHRYVWDIGTLTWVPETGTGVVGAASITQLYPLLRVRIIDEDHRYVFNTGTLDWEPETQS